MLRAMDAAVSGLRAHQQKLDVIGNNIANVNTVGFKSQSYSFKDTMYQSSTASTNGTESAGGVNAAQYGYGALMGTISMDMTASTATYVGGFSASIDGEGFFVTKATRNPIGMLQMQMIQRRLKEAILTLPEWDSLKSTVMVIWWMEVETLYMVSERVPLI